MSTIIGGVFIIKQRIASGVTLIALLFCGMHPIKSGATTQNPHTMYAKTTVNIRAKPNTSSKIVGQVNWNDKIKIVRRVNEKWYQIKYKSRKRYICADYIKKRKSKYKTYSSPSNNSFKSYEDATCITNSAAIPQGKLKKKYHLSASGVYMIGDRYCVALGSYYTNKIGTKIDLVLNNGGKKKILKCILADSKADKDTISNHRIHRDGSIAEFIVCTSFLSTTTKRMGDISYADNAFVGKIVEIRVYQ